MGTYLLIYEAIRHSILQYILNIIHTFFKGSKISFSSLDVRDYSGIRYCTLQHYHDLCTDLINKIIQHFATFCEATRSSSYVTCKNA